MVGEVYASPFPFRDSWTKYMSTCWQSWCPCSAGNHQYFLFCNTATILYLPPTVSLLLFIIVACNDTVLCFRCSPVWFRWLFGLASFLADYLKTAIPGASTPLPPFSHPIEVLWRERLDQMDDERKTGEERIIMKKWRERDQHGVQETNMASKKEMALKIPLL